MACSDQRKAFPKEDKSEITPIFAKALERQSQQLKKPKPNQTKLNQTKNLKEKKKKKERKGKKSNTRIQS